MCHYLYVFHQLIFVKIAIFLIVNALVVCMTEMVFRFGYFKIAGARYQFIPKIDSDNIYLEPHPYLTFAYKKNFQSQRISKFPYPLNKDREYFVPQLTSNNFRHNDGIDGSRKLIVPKPENQFRIVCLGDSITGNYISHENNVYSYPLELERYLVSKFPENDIAVHNCGNGGWTSADVLIDYLLNIYDTKPDVVIVYFAYNDIRASLVPGFQTDYSHCMRNLGEKYIYYKMASFLPDLPLGFYNLILNKIFPYMNPRYGVLKATARGKQDFDRDFGGVSTYSRNIEHLIKVCKTSNMSVILSTYANYLYDEIGNSKIHKKYREGILIENEQIKILAQKYNLDLVDSFNIIPQNEEYFVDSIHFTPEGMKLLARNIGKKIEKSIAQKAICQSQI